MPAGDAGEQRIEELERKLADALRRIDALEGRRAAPPAASTPVHQPLRPVAPGIPAPPPIVSRPKPVPAPSKSPEVVAPARVEAAKPVAEANPKMASRIEYDLGAKVMPWLGSLIMVVGIGFLIGTGIERGWFTPWMQFGLAALISLSLVGIGFWKRATKEDFGGILIGIGSCGMFLTIAGGQVFHQLYSKEALVGSFLSWGLINLAYSSFIRSRAFLVIGYLGGLGAALMPMAEQNFEVNAILHFVIVIPSLIIAVRNKWFTLITISWFVSCGALMPGMYSETEWWMRSGAFVLTTLLTSIAYCLTFEPTDGDRKGAFVTGITLIAGIVAVIIRNDVVGAGFLLAAGTASVVAAIALRRWEPAKLIGLGGTLVILLLSPMGFRDYVPAAMYGVFVLLCALASLKWAPATSVILAWIVSGFGLIAYMLAAMTESVITWPVEMALLSLLSGGVVFASWAANRVYPKAESWTFTSCMVALPIVARMSWVIGEGPMQKVISPDALIALVFLVASMLLAHLAGRRWLSALTLSWFVVGIAALIYGAVAPTLPLGIDLILLAAGAASILVIVRSTGVHVKPDFGADGVHCIGGALLLLIASRAAWILFSGPFVGFLDPRTAQSLLWIGFAVVFKLLADRKWSSSHAFSCLMLGGAGAIYGLRPDILSIPYAPHMAMLLAATSAFLFIGRRSFEFTHSEMQRQVLIFTVGILVSGTATRVLYITLIQPFVGASPMPSMIACLAVASLGSSVYLGFRKEWPALAALASGWGLLGVIAYFWLPVVGVAASADVPERFLRPLGDSALPLGILLLATITVAAGLSSRNVRLRGVAGGGAMVVNWPQFVQVGLLIVGGTIDPSRFNWIVTGLWVAYGVILISVGFFRDQQVLRFGSFGVFGLAVGKIFFVDLAQSLDPVLRVVILLALGMAMLGGGYVYIRTRADRDGVPVPDRAE